MPTKRWYKDWLGWVIVVAIAYSIICLLSLASDVGRPFPGFLTYLNIPLGRIETAWNVPSWWLFQEEDGPAINDTIISVEGVPFTNLTEPLNEQEIYENLQANNKQSFEIQIQRDDEILFLDIPLRILSWRHYVDITLGPFILTGSLLLLAVILFLASGTVLVQRIAILILTAIAALIYSHSSLFLYGQFHDHFLGYNNPINATAAIFLGPLLFHFAFHYPTSIFQNKRFLSKVPVALYGFAFISLGIYLLSRLFINTQGISPQVKLLDYITLESVFYFLFIGVGALLLRLISDGFFRPVHPRAYREARVMLAAILFALPAFGFAAYGAASTRDSIANMSSLADPRYFILAVPLALTTITLRYYPNQSLNKWLIFVWTVVTSAILANIVLIMLFYKNPGQIGNYPIPPTLLLLILFLIVGVFANWQSSWRGWLGRLFNWDRINYRAVQNFGHALAAQPYSDQSQLAQNIVTTLCHELSLEGAACWLVEGDSMQLSAADGRLRISTPQLLHPPKGLIDHPIRLKEPKPDWLQPVMSEITVILPLFISGRLLGVIAVGQRWDAAIFDDRDLEILTLISQEAALMLHNTQQTVQLRQTGQQLLRIQELTRQKTAQNLHDHVLPTLSLVQMRLLTANQLINTQPDKAQEILAESQESLRKNSDLVRRIQKDLVIRSLEYGLSPYLRELVDKFNHDMGITTNLQLPPSLDSVITNTSTRETIYAVWQQALDNIYQHAQATQVTITMELDSDQLTFTICDNGRGSQPDQRQEALKKGHFGLRSMQIRLQSIGGQFVFQSAPDQGSCVQGQIPLPDTKNP